MARIALAELFGARVEAEFVNQLAERLGIKQAHTRGRDGSVRLSLGAPEGAGASAQLAVGVSQVSPGRRIDAPLDVNRRPQHIPGEHANE
jgi:hypothetical protein